MCEVAQVDVMPLVNNQQSSKEICICLKDEILVSRTDGLLYFAKPSKQYHFNILLSKISYVVNYISLSTTLCREHDLMEILLNECQIVSVQCFSVLIIII